MMEKSIIELVPQSAGWAAEFGDNGRRAAGEEFEFRVWASGGNSFRNGKTNSDKAANDECDDSHESSRQY